MSQAFRRTEVDLDRYVEAVMHRARVWRIFVQIGVSIGAVVFTSTVMLGPARFPLALLAPADAEPAVHVAWLEFAYQHWWASSANLAGYLTYGVLAVCAVVVAVTYLIGAALVGYVAAGLSRLVDPEVDWFNRDGRFGWRPATRVYHSMLTGHALFGLILTVLWLERFPLVIALTIGYVVGLLVLVLVVRSLSRAMERRAKSHRLRELGYRLADRTGGPQDEAALVAEMERSRRMRIRPFGMDARRGVVYVVAWLLPLAAGLWRCGAFGN